MVPVVPEKVRGLDVNEDEVVGVQCFYGCLELGIVIRIRPAGCSREAENELWFAIRSSL